MQLQQSVPTELPTSTAINELHFGNDINTAVEQSRRADFSLLLAMFSEDVRETTPIEQFDTAPSEESDLRSQLDVPQARPLASDQSSYSSSAEIAKHFHAGGIQSAQLQADLRPDALAYIAENTHGLGEETYRNLSFHAKRQLINQTTETLKPVHLYQDLVVANRKNQIHNVTA
ncbi:VC2046/SO_2500 family protein [Vibrio sp. 99-8-1]|uniref:VC2046/SO_2500 family protein n=1 Tax=Vibrio sp. 99-8-1 TaxID=2607602 RepID=UPI0014935DEE|nr:VC2046/SO_2500 family protein [Vibrio sp. 99-8-1]NOI65668.1 hypothetical protein [Vibrio sp. 99-8-1]